MALDFTKEPQMKFSEYSVSETAGMQQDIVYGHDTRVVRDCRQDTRDSLQT